MLELAQQLGWLREPQVGATPELSNTTLLTVTDGWCITALGVFGAYLAVAAIVFAIWAEHRGEDSLNLGVGFVCSGIALFLLHPVSGGFACAFGAALILMMRRRRNQLPE